MFVYHGVDSMDGVLLNVVITIWIAGCLVGLGGMIWFIVAYSQAQEECMRNQY